MKVVLACPDLHAPWHCRETVSKIISLAEKIKPDVIINLGDSADFFSFSRFPKQNMITPKDEIDRARASLEEIWTGFKIASPKSECILLRGNHCNRASKRIIEKAPELEVFFNDKDFFKFKGVQTIYDPRQEVEIDGAIYIHGHFSRLGEHALFYNKSVVHGHRHVGAVVFYNRHGRRSDCIFELDAGHACDPLQVPLQYTPTKFSRWTKGCGVVDSMGPRFIPL